MNPEQLGVTPDLVGLSAVDERLLWTSGLVLLAALLRWGAPLALRPRVGVLSDRARWWINFTRNLATVGGALVLATIWADEIEAFAFSIAAFAVALVVATKELILNIAGATWRTFAAPFSVGDWVEVGGYSGEVIEENLLATRLQEIDPYDFRPTGRVVTVPNAALLAQTSVNNSFQKRFTFFTFTLHAEPHADALATEARIAEAVRAACAPFADLAARYAARIEQSVGAHLRDPEPQITVHTTDLAKIAFHVSVFCPRERAAEVREAAARALLAPPRAEAASPVVVDLADHAGAAAA